MGNFIFAKFLTGVLFCCDLLVIRSAKRLDMESNPTAFGGFIFILHRCSYCVSPLIQR